MRKRAPRNRTLDITATERNVLKKQLAFPGKSGWAINGVVNGDAFDVLQRLEPSAYSLLFADPPYNLDRKFGAMRFRRTSTEEYEQWLDSWVRLCLPLLRPDASIYICGDWRSSSSIERVGARYFQVRNRITWEREKGRGASRNWKNASEDLWFFTVSDEYTFNSDRVKTRRRVIAPYRESGQPKDWEAAENGRFRDTYPSNLWTDLTVPFWSMPENTDHPTQKPEKLLAKVILASTNPGDLVLDPFAGSGTTAVTAKKLDRRFTAIESDADYCMLALKRLELAERDKKIQGLTDGVFWERNSGPGK